MKFPFTTSQGISGGSAAENSTTGKGDEKMKLRPELKSWKYWAHLPIIAVVVLGILQLTTGGDMLTVKNVLWSVPLLAAGDIVAHTVLGID